MSLLTESEIEEIRKHAETHAEHSVGRYDRLRLLADRQALQRNLRISEWSNRELKAARDRALELLAMADKMLKQQCSCFIDDGHDSKPRRKLRPITQGDAFIRWEDYTCPACEALAHLRARRPKPEPVCSCWPDPHPQEPPCPVHSALETQGNE